MPRRRPPSTAVTAGTTSPTTLSVTPLTAAIPDGTLFEIAGDPNTPNVVFTTTAVEQVGATWLPVTMSFPSGSTDVNLSPQRPELARRRR